MASLTKRWLLGTYQGSVQSVHLQANFDEFCLRFNRRNSRKRGILFYRLLERSFKAPPVTEVALLKRTKPRARPTIPPDLRRVHANTLDIEVRPKPWRRLPSL